MPYLRVAAATLFALACCGCASVINGTTDTLRVDTITANSQAIVGADCTLTNDKDTSHARSGSTSVVHRSGVPLEIVCRKAGLPDAQGTLLSQTSGAVAGNFILGGAIGMAVDRDNGAAYTYPHWVRLVFGQHDMFDPSRETEGVALSGKTMAMTSAGATHEAAVPLAPRTQPGEVPAAAASSSAWAILAEPRAAGVTPPARPNASSEPTAFEYRWTDRASHHTQTVVIHAVGSPQGEAAALGELHRLTPPDGWLPAGGMPTGSWGMRYTSQTPGPTEIYELTAHREGEETLSVGGAEVHVVRIGMKGFVELFAGTNPARAPYRATAWFSPELHRVVRFQVSSRAPGGYGGAGFIIDESAELVRIVRD